MSLKGFFINDSFKPLEPKLDRSKKVQRYRAGQAPQATKQDADADKFISEKVSRSSGRRRIAAQVIKKAESASSEDEDQLRREKLRQRHLEQEESSEDEERRQRIRARALAAAESSEEEGIPESLEKASSSSEWETDSDEEPEEKLLKPVFVPKAARDTIKQQEMMLQLEQEKEHLVERQEGL